MIADLRAAAVDHGLAAALGIEGDLYAVTVRLDADGHVPDGLLSLLNRLTSTSRSGAGIELGCLSADARLRVDLTGPALSPTMTNGIIKHGPAPFDAPAYVNAAIAEMMAWPVDTPSVLDPHTRVRTAMAAHRDLSSVPWILNELLTVIEHRIGAAQPESVPPEVHIAVSGLCNIECNFCSYSHAAARKDKVAVNQMMRLDFLRYVRTLRLHSGNGEPTSNPALADIIRFIEGAYPQISMNFFTNGILLDRPGLIPALVGGQVSWISVSLNAASRESWKQVCGTDHFDRICANVRAVLDEKRRRGAAGPIVYGTMVLTRASVWDLPLMPRLCRELGVDRFTAIPFFSLGYDSAARLGPQDAYHHVGRDYDQLYAEAVAAAREWEVSIELPAPRNDTRAAFGTEQRIFLDFARTELHDGRLSRLLEAVEFEAPEGSHCHFLWRQASIGSTTKHQGAADDTHFMYPCLGPLAALDMASQSAFGFSEQDEFKALWRSPLFTTLRHGQTQRGIVDVCDTCRGCDSRSPETMGSMEILLAEFARSQGLSKIP